jgi:predicted alpha-1,2-mannosidase
VRSLLEMARQTGRFPKWPLAGGDSGTMNGAPAELVLADAYLKGLRDFDAQEAYERLRRAAMDPDAPPASRGGRSDVEPYLRLGYVPAGTGASVSQTTEYARGDFALGQWARALGREDDARLLLSRSLGYRKLYDPGTGFLRPRRADGTLPHDRFDPLCFCPDYTEANAWHSLWMPSYDVEGLAQLAGGPERLLARLSEFFDKGQEDYEASDPKSLAAGAGPRPYYWHGNQPDIHAAYLFPLLGRPDLARRWVRWIMTHWYSDTPDGLAGNDDGGTLSAWYVFSALGLYPHIGTDAYVLGVPLFPRAEVRVPGGTFTIAAPGVSAERYQVEAVELDGTRIDGPLLRHGEIRAGRTLRFIIR